MIPRHQLPAHSPLCLRALFAGLASALSNGSHHLLVERIRLHWGARTVVLTDTGTSALTLALRAKVRDPADLIALPAYGCYDLATSVLGTQARAILYDVDPHTLAPDLQSLERALAQRPAALVLVHLFGVPVDVPAIAELAGSDTLIIEDAAQAFGASIRNRPAGSFGSIAILSFGRGKGLTGGAGGAIISNDALGDAISRKTFQELDQTSTSGWGTLGRATAQWLLARPRIYAAPASIPFLRLGETIFQPPRNPRPLARSSSAVVDAIWELAIAEIAARRHNAARLVTAARSVGSWNTIATNGQVSPGYLRLPMRSANGRPELLTPAARRLGIIQGYPLPLFDLPGFRDRCTNASAGFPGADALAQSLITLPTHSLLSGSDLDKLEHWLRRRPVAPARHSLDEQLRDEMHNPA